MHGNKKAASKINKMARYPKTSNTPSNFGKSVKKLKDYTGKSGTGTLPASQIQGTKT